MLFAGGRRERGAGSGVEFDSVELHFVFCAVINEVIAVDTLP